MKKYLVMVVVLLTGVTACKVTQGHGGQRGTAVGVAIDEAHFPDAAFRGYLLEQGYGKDGVITDSELSAVYKLDLTNRGVRSLQGLELFYNLSTLVVKRNALDTLVLPRMPRLMTLDCIACSLTCLDFTACQELRTVYCNANSLEQLSVTGLPQLEHLEANNNRLSSVQLSGVGRLRSLNLAQNPLGSLDLSRCKGLESVGIKGTKLSAAALQFFVEHLPQAVDYPDPVRADVLPSIYGLADYELTPKQRTAVEGKGWRVE